MDLGVIQQNVDRMMSCRGFHLDHKDDENVLIYKHQDNTAVVVFFYRMEKLNIDAVKDFIMLLGRLHIHHGIVVYHGNVTSSTKKVLEHMHKFNIELFASREFKYCLVDHQLYCPHRRLPPKEAQEIVDAFGTNLPVLLKTDAVSRFFSFCKNDIIEITRKNHSIAYRIVK